MPSLIAICDSLLSQYFLLYEICLIVNKICRSLIKRLLIDFIYNILLIQHFMGTIIGQLNVYEFKYNVKFQRQGQRNQ